MSYSSDDDSVMSGVSDLFEQLEAMEATMAEMAATSDRINRRLADLERPISEVELASLSDTKHLRDSPFRQATFRFKQHVNLPFIDRAKRYTFAEICATMRSYLIAAVAVDADGVIALDETTQRLLETQESRITFPQLAALLRNVLL